MKVKELIEILKQMPQDYVAAFEDSESYYGDFQIQSVWVCEEGDEKRVVVGFKK